MYSLMSFDQCISTLFTIIVKIYNTFHQKVPLCLFKTNTPIQTYTQATTDLFSVTLVLPFVEIHIYTMPTAPKKILFSF